MEMNAILHQKELETAHQKGLMGMENPLMYQANAMAFRGRQRMLDGHDIFVDRPILDDLHSNSMVMSTGPYPPIGTLHRERGRRVGRRPASHKSAESHMTGLKGQVEDKGVERSPGTASGEEKDAEAKGDMGEEASAAAAAGHKTHLPIKMDSELTAVARKNYKETEQSLRKACNNGHDSCPDAASSGNSEKDMSSQCSAFQEKFMFPAAAGNLTGVPHMFPVPGIIPPGTHLEILFPYMQFYYCTPIHQVHVNYFFNRSAQSLS